MVRRIEWSNDIAPSDLSEVSRRIFVLPDHAQYSLNAYSMVNFSPIIRRIAEAMAAKSLCEVGIDRGEQSEFLLALASDLDARVTLVDPVIAPELRAHLLDRGGTRLTIEERTSHDYLSDAPAHDVYLIDGDHNYETVIGELLAIERATAQHESVVFLHDVGWPFAYRDMYYGVDRIGAPRPHGRGHLIPFSEDIGDYGLPFGMDVAVSEGGSGNGVMAAVEDFVAQSGRSWDFFWINVYFGLGVLWDPQQTRPEVRELLTWYRGAVDLLKPLLGHIELNRLMLLTRLEDAGAVWRRQRDEIDRLRARLDEVQT